MLYVTTRNNQDTFTTHYVLTENRGRDGGLYIPLRFPRFSAGECLAMEKKSFGQRVADILNLFFSTKLSGWDIDFCIGRYPVRLVSLGHRIVMAENWHNPDWSYDRLVKNLTQLLLGEVTLSGNWVAVAVRIAVLFGILGERGELGSERIDIAVVSGDFTAPVSAWFARKMGLPIGNIICCCNENNQVWDLLCHGQMRTDSVSISTIVPEADIVLPVNLERLLYSCGGAEETSRYLTACTRGLPYWADAAVLEQMRQGMYVSVVSSSRIASAIPNVYKTHDYLMTPATALAYSGLMDYRTKAGVTRTAVVLCDRSPVCDAEAVASAMDLPVEEIMKII